MTDANYVQLQELDHLFRKLVRKYVKERDKITIEGITLPGVMILRQISLLGEQRLSDLAEQLDLSSGAITAQCDKLEEGGYAERIRYKEDRRTIYLNITEQGIGLLERYHNIGQLNMELIFRGFSQDEVTQQLRIFRKLIENVEGMSEQIMSAVASAVVVNDKNEQSTDESSPNRESDQAVAKHRPAQPQTQQSKNDHFLSY